MIYIDTSVLVPYYCPEPNSEKMEKIIMESVMPGISSLTFEKNPGRKSFTERRKQNHSRISVPCRAKSLSDDSCQFLHCQIAKDWIARFATPLKLWMLCILLLLFQTVLRFLQQIKN